jgi:hypothetical protein
MTRRAILPFVLAAACALAACGSGDSSDGGGATTSVGPTGTTASTETESTESSTTEATAVTGSTIPDDTGSSGSDLVGQWEAEAGDILQTLTAPFGGGAPECNGPYLITFGDDGTFGGDVEVTCTVEVLTAVGEFTIEGQYTAEGGTLEVTDSVVQGGMTVDGTPLPLPIDDGLAQPFAAPAQYEIDGDQLRIGFTAPDGTDYTLEFTRVS